MKNWIVFLSVLFFIIVSVLMIKFDFFPKNHTSYYDDDQEGLKDRIVFKFSHVTAENTPKGLAANQFAELVYAKSNGKIKIEVFPNGSLFSDIEEIEALKNNEVQFIAPSTSKLGMISSEWYALDLPFAFNSYHDVHTSLQGELGKRLFITLENKNMKGLGYWTNGFKQLTSNIGPIKNPKDLKGQSLRIMQSDVIEAQFKHLGATPIQHSFNSTFQLLEQGKVDGEENTISNIYSKKFYHVQNYLTISNHGYLGYAVMTSRSFWNKQSAETKRILSEAMKETTAWNEQLAIQMNNDQLQKMKESSSITIYELDTKELEKWKEAFEPVYDEYSPIIGKELTEKIRNLR